MLSKTPATGRSRRVSGEDQTRLVESKLEINHRLRC